MLNILQKVMLNPTASEPSYIWVIYIYIKYDAYVHSLGEIIV